MRLPPPLLLRALLTLRLLHGALVLPSSLCCATHLSLLSLWLFWWHRDHFGIEAGVGCGVSAYPRTTW